nr:hypothetical protein BdHM001_35740 [Bdellovibrio sp. HM001]
MDMTSLFYPPLSRKIYDTKSYIDAIEDGKTFRDVFCLGVCEQNGGSWLLKDFGQEPHALYVGTTGSGKSKAGSFTLTTYTATNSDHAIIFIADVIKGAGDYSHLFDLPNVYTSVNEKGFNANEGLKRMIDLMYSEAQVRQEEFINADVPDLPAYERLTGKKIARIVLFMEEFHAIPYGVLAFDKDYKKKYTSAEKFFKLMRIGRSLGIWIIGASQKSTKSDVPTEIRDSFTQRLIFRVSQGEAQYVLGDLRPAFLRTDQKGRCFHEEGEVQFPFISQSECRRIVEKYAKPFNAECFYLKPEMIKKYLSGKDGKELYSHKRVSELTEAIESHKGEIVLEICHEKLGHSWESVNSKIDPYGICGIITDQEDKRYCVAYETGKVGFKTIANLVRAIKENKTNGAVLYCLADGLSARIYKDATEAGILIYDHKDLIRFGEQLDTGKVDVALRMYKLLANNDEHHDDEGYDDEFDEDYLPPAKAEKKPRATKLPKDFDFSSKVSVTRPMTEEYSVEPEKEKAVPKKKPKTKPAKEREEDLKILENVRKGRVLAEAVLDGELPKKSRQRAEDVINKRDFLKDELDTFLVPSGQIDQALKGLFEPEE